MIAGDDKGFNNHEGFTLSTGRRVYANCGIVGMSAAGPVGISEGYDGGIDDKDWTPEERRELAAHMIERWAAYGAIDR